jgi:hypothetical protein
VASCCCAYIWLDALSPLMEIRAASLMLVAIIRVAANANIAETTVLALISIMVSMVISFLSACAALYRLGVVFNYNTT